MMRLRYVPKISVQFVLSGILLVAGLTIGARTLIIPELKSSEQSVSVSVGLVTSAEIQHLLSIRKGNIIILNYWATWCAPCVKEMPGLVAVYKAYEAKNVSLLLVSLDQPDEIESDIKPFLKQVGVTFETYIKNPEEPVTPFIDNIDPSWSGAIPRTFVYDRSGEIILKHTGYLDRIELESIIKKHL